MAGDEPLVGVGGGVEEGGHGVDVIHDASDEVPQELAHALIWVCENVGAVTRQELVDVEPAAGLVGQGLGHEGADGVGEGGLGLRRELGRLDVVGLAEGLLGGELDLVLAWAVLVVDCLEADVEGEHGVGDAAPEGGEPVEGAGLHVASCVEGSAVLVDEVELELGAGPVLEAHLLGLGYGSSEDRPGAGGVGAVAVVRDVAEEPGDAGLPGEDCEAAWYGGDPHVALLGGEESEGGAVDARPLAHLFPDLYGELDGPEVAEYRGELELDVVDGLLQEG